MSLLEVILIAFALSMDAFAVSVTLGLSVKKAGIVDYLTPGLYFGFFHALMPLIGYFAGTYFTDKIQNLDHWIAFALLCIIGGKMIVESFSKEKEKTGNNSLRCFKMLCLAVATSIDALVVGVTFAFFETNIFIAIAIIGLITFFVSIVGVKAGNIFGAKYRSKAEFLGGAVLIILGFKLLFEHLFF